MVFQRTLLERGRRRCDRFFCRHQQFPICLEWSFFPVDDRRGAKACHVAFTPQSSGGGDWLALIWFYRSWYLAVLTPGLSAQLVAAVGGLPASGLMYCRNLSS